MVNFDPRTENKSMSVLTPKPSQFLPHHKNKSISIPTLKTSQSCMPPDTKTKLISIQSLTKSFSTLTQNQANYDPYTEIKSTPIPHTEITSISTAHTTTKSISMPTPKTCHFRAVWHCLYTPYVHPSGCSSPELAAIRSRQYPGVHVDK